MQALYQWGLHSRGVLGVQSRWLRREIRSSRLSCAPWAGRLGLGSARAMMGLCWRCIAIVLSLDSGVQGSHVIFGSSKSKILVSRRDFPSSVSCSNRYKNPIRICRKLSLTTSRSQITFATWIDTSVINSTILRSRRPWQRINGMHADDNPDFAQYLQ
jgi:hypothetical protein